MPPAGQRWYHQRWSSGPSVAEIALAVAIALMMDALAPTPPHVTPREGFENLPGIVLLTLCLLVPPLTLLEALAVYYYGWLLLLRYKFVFRVAARATVVEDHEWPDDMLAHAADAMLSWINREPHRYNEGHQYRRSILRMDALKMPMPWHHDRWFILRWSAPHPFSRYGSIRASCEEDDYKYMAHTVQLRLANKPRDLSEALFEVFSPSRRCWIPFVDYLVRRYPDELHGYMGPFSTQYDMWIRWEINGKAFPFLALPRELRDMIYEYVCPYVYPNYCSNGWNYLPAKKLANQDTDYEFFLKDYGSRGTYQRAEREGTGRILNGPGPIMSLLLANKQVYREFTARITGNTEFRFYGTEDDVAYDLTYLAAPSAVLGVHKPWMTHLSLELIYLGGRRGPAYTSQLSHAIITCWPLQSLEFRIPHRTTRNHELNVCRQVELGQQLLLWRRWATVIPQLTVTGCIPAQMKARFEQYAREEWEGGFGASRITDMDLVGHSRVLTVRNLRWSHPAIRSASCNTLDGGSGHVCMKQNRNICQGVYCIAEHNFRAPPWAPIA